MIISMAIPIRVLKYDIQGKPNQVDNHRRRRRRSTYRALLEAFDLQRPSFPVAVTMIRVSRGVVSPYAFGQQVQSVQWGIADFLSVDVDDSDNVVWQFRQRGGGENIIVVRIESVDPVAMNETAISVLEEEAILRAASLPGGLVPSDTKKTVVTSLRRSGLASGLSRKHLTKAGQILAKVLREKSELRRAMANLRDELAASQNVVVGDVLSDDVPSDVDEEEDDGELDPLRQLRTPLRMERCPRLDVGLLDRSGEAPGRTREATRRDRGRSSRARRSSGGALEVDRPATGSESGRPPAAR